MNIRLKRNEKLKILCSDDLYTVMQKILLRETRIDRNREHLWTISLDNAHTILNIELVSMGSVNKLVIEPMEVFSVPLQKRAVTIVLVHNHPSGDLKPSEKDKDITDRLIQCGLIMHVPVLDHLIITKKKYFSFADSGLLKELEMSKKYVPEYKLREQYLKEESIQKGQKQKALKIAMAMKTKREPVDKIMEYTGLDRKAIRRIKANH
jgi:DNA repair protein RadC